MAERTLQVTLEVRQDSATAWDASTYVLRNGEFGYDTTNKVLKIGDGVSAWSALPGFIPEANSAVIEYLETAPTASDSSPWFFCIPE